MTDAVRPSVDQMRELVAFLPRLQGERGAPRISWVHPPGSFPYPSYDDVVLEFFRAVQQDCWRDVHYGDQPVGEWIENEGFVRRASLDEIRTMLTWCDRGERFADGHWGSVIASGAVHRILERLAVLVDEIESGGGSMPLLVIEKLVEIAAPPETVFTALTDPEQIVRVYPLKKVESDGHTGGGIRLHGEVDGQSFIDHGRIEAFEAPRLFAYSYWSDNHGTERRPEFHMSIRYELRPTSTGTNLTMRHANLLTAERHAQMHGAWDFLLGELKRYAEERSA